MPEWMFGLAGVGSDAVRIYLVGKELLSLSACAKEVEQIYSLSVCTG